MGSDNVTPALIVIVTVIWLVFIGAFIVPVRVAERRRRRDIAWLQAHGWRVTVTVASIEDQRGLSLRTPLSAAGAGKVIVAQSWDDPQRQSSVVFTSDPLRGTFAPDLVGATVDVVIDPDNPNRYWMDVATLR